MGLGEVVLRAVERLRLAGTDPHDIEVKAAAGGLPRSIPETVSAFANGTGGLILLGLDENDGFTPVAVNAQALADGLAGACADAVEPPVRAEIDIVAVDGMPVVAAVVPEASALLKPCFVRTQGLERGSYIRGHDGDRHLTSYEIHLLMSSRGQPREDAQLVPGTSLADLDPRLVAALVDRLRSTRGPVFADLDNEHVLHLVGVLGPVHDGVRPVTLAGLLALGRYPQQFFPQLNTTLVVYPTVDGTPMPDGTRFLDNVVLDGSIPAQLAAGVAALTRNMARRSVIVGLGRDDRWEYPQEALREVLVNALMHRDYHPLAHGTQVQVELFPDRLVVTNPGGLHGPVAPEDLLTERVSSSRNAVLSKLLEDVVVPGTNRAVCENRGTGLLAVSAALRATGMEPPVLTARLRSFRVELSNHTLLDQNALTWLAGLGDLDLTDRQRLGLAHARRAGSLSNAEYRALTGTDSHTATQDLMALGAAGLLVRESAGRGTTWHLAHNRPETLPGLEHHDAAPRQHNLPPRQREIVALLAEGARSTSDLAQAAGISPQAVWKHLRVLEAEGFVVPTASDRRSRTNTWTLTTRAVIDTSPEGKHP